MSTIRNLDANYTSLFEPESRGEDNGGVQSSKSSAIDDFYRFWGWLVSIDELAGGDPLKWDTVADQNVIWFLNALSYLKDKNKMKDKLNGN